MNLKFLSSAFSYQNLFGINTTFISPQEKLVLFAGATAFLLGIVLRIAASLAPNPIDKAFRHSLYRVFMFFGVSEMVWYLCRYENAIFFGTHFVAGLLALISFIWFVVIIWKFIKNYSKDKAAWEKEQLRQKYLPQ